MSELACCRSPLTGFVGQPCLPCRRVSECQNGVGGTRDAAARAACARCCPRSASLVSRGRTPRRKRGTSAARTSCSPPRQGRHSSEEHRRRTIKESRGPPPAPGSIFRGVTTGQGDGTNGYAHPAARKTSSRTSAAGSAEGCQTNSRSKPEPAKPPALPMFLHQAHFWADCWDSSDADDGERAQTAGLETGGDEEDSARARRPRATGKHRDQTSPRAKGEGGIKALGAPGRTARRRTWRKRKSRSNVPKKRWNAPKKSSMRPGLTKPQPKARHRNSASWWPRTQK